MWFILKNEFKFLTLMTLQLKNCYCTFTGLVMQSQYDIWTILCLIQVIQAMRKSTQKQRLLEIELYCITSQVRARVKFIFCFNSCVKMVSQRDTNCTRSFSQLSIVRINSCFDLSLHFKEVSINTVSINFPKRFWPLLINYWGWVLFQWNIKKLMQRMELQVAICDSLTCHLVASTGNP